MPHVTWHRFWPPETRISRLGRSGNRDGEIPRWLYRIIFSCRSPKPSDCCKIAYKVVSIQPFFTELFIQQQWIYHDTQLGTVRTIREQARSYRMVSLSRGNAYIAPTDPTQHW
jgi:hypothetical protein